MESTIIRQKLHNYLEVANEKKIKAIYTMMEQDVEESLVAYSDDLKKELDQRLSDYKNGNVEMITAKQSKERISKIMKDKFG